VRAGHISDVAAALRGIPGLISVDLVTGPHDIIVVFEAESLRAVGDLITGMYIPSAESRVQSPVWK
jgi:hypothetical protein